MKRVLIAAVTALGLAALSVPVLEACGAKFLLASRAARYQRVRAPQPANIFVYWHEPAADDAERHENDEYYEEFRLFLEGVGHSIEVTTDEDTFRAAARSGDFDIIMMPLDGARQFRGDIASLAPRAALLPVLEFGTRAEKSRARDEFGHVLSTPARSRDVLKVIEESLSK